MIRLSRRAVLKSSAVGAAAMAAGPLLLPDAQGAEKKGSQMAYGLVTYMWGADWDLPTLLTNCEQTGVLGVELRSTHKHGVEPSLNKQQRAEVKKRFDASPVTLLGPGSNERFDNPDPAVVKKAIEASKAFIVLSHDVGGTGVKVKPDRFWPDVPREKTIEQIGNALNELGEFAAGFGQQVRLEVHGQCNELPTIKKIADIATDPNVALCWNCNPQDLEGAGLASNFNLVKDRFGETFHVHEFDDKYPYAELMKLLVEMDYAGWLLLEASSKPADRVAALAEQRKLFEKLRAQAQA